MQIINNIFKERLSQNKNIKNRYYKYYLKIDKQHKTIFTLDNINYCLYTMRKIFFSLENIKYNSFNKNYKISVIYYKNGLKHRDGVDIKGNEQPAIFYIPYDKTNHKEYWLRGYRYC